MNIPVCLCCISLPRPEQLNTNSTAEKKQKQTPTADPNSQPIGPIDPPDRHRKGAELPPGAATSRRLRARAEGAPGRGRYLAEFRTISIAGGATKSTDRPTTNLPINPIDHHPEQADERKRRTLAAYDAIARSGVAGPKLIVREELEQMESKFAFSLPPEFGQST